MATPRSNWRGIAIKMVRKYDKFGYNRQFKINPCNRRDPFPRDHLPFIDDMSVLSEMHGSGIGSHGPRMPQPITSRPIEQTPGNQTPVYKPGPKTPGTINYEKFSEQVAKALENSPNISKDDVEHELQKQLGKKFGEDFLDDFALSKNPIQSFYAAASQLALFQVFHGVRDHFNKIDRLRDRGYSGGKFKGDDVFGSPATKPYSKRP